nr:hypothetical protein [Brevundimonas naejangsanensis]
MAEGTVVGSAEFELRATTDKLKSDLARAERETKAEMKKVEDAARHAQAELKRAFSDAGHSEFERSMRIIRNASDYTEDEVRAAAERVAKDLKGRYRDLGSDIGRTFAGISRSAQLAFAAVTAYSLKLASDAEDIDDAFGFTFSSMEAKARKSAEQIAESFERTGTQIKGNMTTLYQVLTGLGVETEASFGAAMALTQRSIDLASQKGISDARAFQAILSGLTGETEPLKGLGVVLNQAAVEAELLRMGFKGNASEATEAQKAAARLNLILEKTKTAQGDVARTADSANNKTKAMQTAFNNAAESLGKELLPAMTQVFGAATNVLKVFNDLPSGVQVAGLAFLGLVAAGGPIAGLMANLGKLIKLANDTRKALIGAGLGGATAGAGVGVAAPVAAVAGVLSLGGDTKGPNTDAQSRVNNALREEERVRGEIVRLTREGKTAEAQRQQAYLDQVRARREITQNVLAGAKLAGEVASDLGAADTQVIGGFTAALPPGANPKRDNGRSGRGRTGPTEADIAAMREALDLQNALDLARASGNSAQIKALERKQELARLTADFERAGYEDAATKAQDHLKALDAVRERSEQIADWEKKSLAFWEELGESVRRQNDLLLDRLGFEAEIARLEGDPDRIKERERELWIEQRINDLLSLRPELTAEARRAQAENEWQRLDTADQTGRMRDEFRYAFTDGIKAAIDGDLGGFFDNLADRFTTRMLDNLADDLFDLLTDAAKGLGKEGGGFWSSIASGIGSMFGFGGGRATGGAMSGGNWYRVGEHGPEDILMPQSGFAVPLGALSSGGSGQPQMTGGNTYQFSGNLMTPEFWRQIQGEIAAGEARAYGRAMNDAPKLTMSQTARQQRQAVGRQRRGS